MREAGLDDGLDPAVILRQLRTPKRDKGGLDVRTRAKRRPRHGVNPDPLGDELYEHRDGAVGLRRRLGEETVRHFPLHHHAPELDAGEAGKALNDQRGGDVVREVRHQLRRVGRDPGEVELQGVAKPKVDVRSAGQTRGQARLQRAVELDRVHSTNPVCEVLGEDAEARADLQHDVLLPELGEPADHAEDVLVDEEVLPKLLLRADAHESANAADAFASIRRPSSSASSARVSASAAIVCTT